MFSDLSRKSEKFLQPTEKHEWQMENNKILLINRFKNNQKFEF